MSRLLVCPPDYFTIEYEINSWMHRSNAVDSDRAVRQRHHLMQVLEQDVGAVRERMKPVPGLPDLVFPASAGVVVGGKAVPSRFRYAEWQKEEAYFVDWNPGRFFEGAGDLLGFPDTWFDCYRQRSDIRVFPTLSDWFHREVIPLELVDDRFYHLDTCLCPLSGGELLLFPSRLRSLWARGLDERIAPSRRLVAPEAEALRFVCNAVCVGKHVVLPAGCPDTEFLLPSHGYLPHPVPLDEFMKSDGSAKCLTLALD